MADPWADFPVVAQSDPKSVGGDVYIPPAGPSAKDMAVEGRAMAGEARAATGQQIQLEKAARERLEWEATHNPDGSLKPKAEVADSDYSQSAMDAFDRAISTATRLKTHPGLSSAVGMPGPLGGQIPFYGALPGSPAADFKAELDTMKAQVFLPMVQSMKGMGALSNAEGEKLTAAIGALDPNMSEGQFQSSLDRIIADLGEYKARGAKPGGRTGVDLSAAGTGAKPIVSGTGNTLSSRDLEYKAEAEQAWLSGGLPAVEAIARKYGGAGLDPATVQILQNTPAGKPISFALDPSQERTAAGEIAGQMAESPVGAYTIGAANALLSGGMDELAPLIGLDANTVEMAKQMLREKYPVSSFVGEVSGQAMQMAGATKALGAAGVAAPRAAGIAEIGGGALYGAGESNENRLGGAAFGAGAAITGRAIGEKLLNPATKAAVEAVAQRSGVPVEAVEQVLQDVAGGGIVPSDATGEAVGAISAASQEEIGNLARQAVGRGRSARKAQRDLAELAKVNPEAKAAADRMGVELPIDVLSDDAQLKTVTGLARSQIASDAAGAWRNTVVDTAQRADAALADLGATPDLAQVSEDVMGRMDGAMKGLERQASTLRREVDEAIDVRERTQPMRTRETLGGIIDDMGGGAEGRAALSTEEKKLLSIMDSNPTYARLNQLRDQIGDALYKNKGPWADTAQANLKRYYGALADDQLAHVAAVGGEELADKFKGSNTLFKKMFDARSEMQAVFGDQLQKDLAPLISNAVTKASKGDAEAMRKLLGSVPEDMRGGVLLSGIMKQAEAKTAQGGFSFSNYAKMYRGLRANAPVYKQIADAVGPQGAQVMTDLYAISRRMAEAERRIVRTGASNQPLLNALNAEGLVSRMVKGAGSRGAAAAAAGVGGIAGGPIGAGAAAALADVASDAITGAGKSRLEKLHTLISSEPFRDLVVKVGTGEDAKVATSRLVGSKEWNSFAARVLGLKTPDQRKQWLQSAITGGAVAGSQAATSEPAYPAPQLKVAPQ